MIPHQQVLSIAPLHRRIAAMLEWLTSHGVRVRCVKMSFRELLVLPAGNFRHGYFHSDRLQFDTPIRLVGRDVWQ